MGLLEKFGRMVSPTHYANLDRFRMENEALREEMRDRKKRRGAMDQLGTLLGPSTAGPGIAATPEMMSNRMQGLLFDAAPEAMTKGILAQQFGSPKDPPRDIRIAQWYADPRTPKDEKEAYEKILKSRTSGTPLSVTDVSKLRFPDGSKVPFGMTVEEAVAAGAEVVTAAEAADTRKREKGQEIRATLERLSRDVFTSEGGLGNRIKTTLQNAWDYFSQEDPAVSQYQNFAVGSVAPLVKSLGESGALATEDVQRAMALIPEVFPLTDTKDVAEGKLDELFNLLGNAKPAGTYEPTPARQLQMVKPINELDDEELQRQYQMQLQGGLLQGGS